MSQAIDLSVTQQVLGDAGYTVRRLGRRLSDRGFALLVELEGYPPAGIFMAGPHDSESVARAAVRHMARLIAKGVPS